MRTIALAILLLGAASASAHPSVSIAIAPNGTVYYSDLTNIWSIDARGVKRIIVPNVHSHELYLDANGTLFGEDNQWLGGDRYRHRIWSRDSSGRMRDVVPWRAGFWREYGLNGGGYWLRCTPANVCTVRQGTRTVATSSRKIGWLASAPHGALYVTAGSELQRVRNGKFETVARLNMPMGMTFDANGDVWVADFGDRAIVRISSAGQKRVMARSTAPWGPTGIGIAANGDLWILEFAGTETRARRIRRAPEKR